MIYRIGEFELDEQRFELREKGAAVRLEPRVLETALYLVQHRDRVVAKDDLAEHVWRVTHISDSAMARCVMEIRKVFASQGGRGWIQTVHGRGWRFVAAVQEVADAAGAAPFPANDDAPAVVLAPPAPSIAASRARHLSFAGVGVTVIAALGAIGLGLVDPAERPRPASSSLGLVPLSVEDEDHELAMVALSVTDLLELRLASVPTILLRHAATVAPRSVAATSLAGLARELRVGHLLTGSVRRSGGGHAQVELTLVDILAPTAVRTLPLGSFDVPLVSARTEVAAFRRVREAIARSVVARLLPALDLGEAAASAPRSIEAYRLYLLARGQLATGGANQEAAVALLESSLRLDAGFEPAWTRLGWTLRDLASFGGPGGGTYDRAIEAADHALALDPGATQALALKAAIATETGHAEEAYALLTQAVARSPRSAELHYFLSYALRFTGCLEASRAALDEARALDPLVTSVYGDAPQVLLYLGDDGSFLASLPGFAGPLYFFHRGLCARRRGDVEESRRQLASAFGAGLADPYVRLCEALLAIEEGAPGDARVILRRLYAQRRRLGSANAEVTFKVAQLQALAGDADGAVETARHAVEGGFFCAPCLDDASTLGTLRQRADFRSVVAAARVRQGAFVRRFGLGAAGSPLPRSASAT